MLEDIVRAHERIAGLVRRTPLERSHSLSAATGCEAYLKLENFQLTGSFKLRGATNRLLSLAPEDLGRGVVAASTGNHGAAVACSASRLGAAATIFAPTNAMASKLEAIRGFGATIVQEGDDCVVSEGAARAFAETHGAAYVSPYNDPQVVAGQGTVGLEIALDLPEVDAVFVAVGGGGLIGGVGAYLRSLPREVEVIGVSPANSAVMHASLGAGRLLDLPSEPTLSDGTAGGVEDGSITFELCREVIDDFVLVTEDEIRDALRVLVAEHHMLVEGAAAAAVAGFSKRGSAYRGRNVAIVLCGANIDAAVLKEIL
ncbi:MAG: threonine/serine dehydratase [bacterium]|nr:threonine/serine dehydratase [bacterium]